MTSEELNGVIKMVRASAMDEREQDKFIVALLDSAMKRKGKADLETLPDAETNKRTEKEGKRAKSEENTGGNLPDPKERQMLINMAGTSITSVPRKDGRFQGYLVREDGRKKYFYGRTYREVAEKIQIELRREQTLAKRRTREADKPKKLSAIASERPSRRATESNHPFDAYAENWIEKYKAPNVKITSLQCIRTSVKPALEAFGGKPLEEITSDDVQSLLLSIRAPRSRELCKINLSQLFKKAVTQRILDVNPCDAVEIRKYKKAHKSALTGEEQGRFLVGARTSPHALLFRLMLSTGLRIGEALALTKSDIDFENSRLTVCKNVIFLKGQRIVQDTPKSEAGNRTIPVPQDICAELQGLPGDTLFPCTYNAAKKALEKIAKANDIKMTLHTLRHTYATRLEEAGIPPKVKQYLLGHSSLEMTQNTYTDAQSAYVESLSERVRAAF
mgnify:FL=1